MTFLTQIQLITKRKKRKKSIMEKIQRIQILIKMQMQKKRIEKRKKYIIHFHLLYLQKPKRKKKNKTQNPYKDNDIFNTEGNFDPVLSNIYLFQIVKKNKFTDIKYKDNDIFSVKDSVVSDVVSYYKLKDQVSQKSTKTKDSKISKTDIFNRDINQTSNIVKGKTNFEGKNKSNDIFNQKVEVFIIFVISILLKVFSSKKRKIYIY